MEKANQIQIGMLGLIILMLGYQIFFQGGSNGLPSAREAARQQLAPAAAAPTAMPTALNAADPTAPAATPAAEPAVPAGPTTSIAYKQSEFDFGTIKEGDKVEHTFEFTNTGKEPLVISNAKGSCGCTVPEWPREPIAPGKSGKIKVSFDSKGKPGTQSKQVTITANTEPANTYLKINANVTPANGDAAAASPIQVKPQGN